MSDNYQKVENRVDNEIKRKREAKLLEETIKRLTQSVKGNGLTEEQEFLAQYYDLNREDIIREKIDISNVDKIANYIPEEKRDELETTRYNILIDLFATFKQFNKQEANKYNDIFHKDITDWEEYVEGFEQEPLMIKKMRNLQMINRMAHQYKTVFRTILYESDSELKRYSDADKSKIENYIDNLFLGTTADKKQANEELVKMLGKNRVNKLKNNQSIRYSIIAGKWMFNQKNKYLIEILEELNNSDKPYNYGICKDGIIFDVPRYGQFAVHLGENNKKRIEDIRKLGVKDYNGKFLGNVFILSKASEELLKKVKYEELSEIDKQRYDIAVQEIKEETEERNDEKNIGTLIENSKDSKKAQKIVDIIKDAGLEPEKLVNETILAKGKPEVIEYIIDIIKENKYGLDLDILYRCKTVLDKGEDRAVDIIDLLDGINELGLNVKEIITEKPNLFTVAKSEKIKPIYEVLKQYKIDLTNQNIATAFMGTSENIKRNMDLVIENGLYDFAKIGNSNFFTTDHKNLNIRVNLLKDNNETLVTEQKNKRKINANLFLKKQDLMEKYGITDKQVLDELSKIRGQELIKDNKYYNEEENQQVTLNENQQELSNNIYEKLSDYQSEDGVVIKIGDYYYSAIKVKEQINSIISNLNIQDLENEDVNEIIKIALFKNKNITQEEVNEVSEQIQNLDKEKTQKKELNEEMPVIDEEPEQEENQQELHEEQPKQENPKYNRIRQMTEEIIEKEHNLETMGEIIKHLKEVRKTLKHKIAEMEEKINQNILNNEEPKDEVIEDIKRLRKIIEQQKEKRKEVKQMIKTYKKNKKIAKYILQQAKETRDNEIDEMEL